MAVLIPRKQIEEQKDFTASLDVRQNLTVSGSLLVSKSFDLGTSLFDKSTITGSIELTGSLNIDGEFIVKNASTTVLSLTASQAVEALQAFDTTKYGGVLARDFGANVPTLYVSATDGDDTNDGRTIQFPLRTVKRAAELATPGFDGRYGLPSGSNYSGYVIRVQAGTYVEDNPVILPKNASIWGSGLRITKILAKNKGEDLFWVNSGCYVAEITMGGLQLYPDQINPEKGFGIAFQPGAFITTSPYVQNCSQISNQENSFTELYEDIPPGGGGLYVNGDIINPDSPLASMVLDAYTQISPNGVGCLVNGRGFIQLVSFFNNFSYYAIRVNNGGHATLNNSNISFGLYGMYASGSRKIDAISGGNEDARRRVRESYSVIVDVLNNGLEAGLPTVTTLNTDEGIKVTPFTQSYTVADASQTEINKISEDFRLVSEIVKSGPYDYPSLLAKSSNKGYDINNPYNILGAQQVTSSISASAADLTQLSASYASILSIFANGTGSYTYKTNTADSIKRTDIVVAPPIDNANNAIQTIVSSSFNNIVKIISGETAPTIISNTSASFKVSGFNEYSTGIASSLDTINSVSASFSIIYNILDNGTGSGIFTIPANHKRSFEVVRGGNNATYDFDGVGSNPTLTLFRGETYKFYVSASVGKDTNPLFIRTSPISGFTAEYDYNDGVVNNGEDFGNITFTVPYNAPNELYYVSQNSSTMVGKFNIVNNSETPFDLIANTLTYPKLVSTGSIASTDSDIINAYDILINNKDFIKEETITFLSSSWSDFSYNQITCKRDIGYIIDAVANDLLYGGNSQSIKAGLFYYLYPSDATTTQKDPTLTAIKYVSGMVENLLKNIEFRDILGTSQLMTISDIANTIITNREFVQQETIAFLSSSWSTFDYNEAKCKRDVGYIVDAVATDLKYGGNERSVTAGNFYYKYPSDATTTQLTQTIDGVVFALGTVLNIINQSPTSLYHTASASTQAAYELLRANKQLIQNETIQFINTTYPTLDYNQISCSRDVGYIVDAISTDMLYGGIARGVKAGRFYYDVPSVATSLQKKETIAGIGYAKILSDYIVSNIILETPSVIDNTESGIKVSVLNNVTSSVSGTSAESQKVKDRFTIIQDIIRKGTISTPAALAKNSDRNWGVANPLNVSTSTQTTSSFTLPTELDIVSDSWNLVTSIIEGGINAIPTLTSSADGLIKITNGIQTTGSLTYEDVVTGSISSSFGTIIDILENGLTAIPTIVLNTENNIQVSNETLLNGTPATNSESASISSSFGTIINVLENGVSVLPTLTQNTAGNFKTSATSQYVSASFGGNATHVAFLSQSFDIVTKIIETGNLDLFEREDYVTRSTNSETVAAYEILKQNIDFIQDETIAYLSSSWRGFDYNEAKCRRDIGYILSGSAEDLIYNVNNQSIVNGQFYYEYPSQATTAQLDQTLDGIRYAARLAQKVITNTVYGTQSSNKLNGADLIVKNKEFIQEETIAYISSSWSSFEYDEVKCRRDVGYMIDAVATDLIYGGNERTRVAAEFYYRFPSEATGNQLIQTVDAVKYVSKLAQKISVGETFTSADSDNLEASRLIKANANLIANEVVEYVSSSWSSVSYNETKCKRDVGYILDAIRTDLVYGGNERTATAGEFYFLYPSSATVGGVPSATAQLDPTVTGINYASKLTHNIVLSRLLSNPSQTILDIAGLIRANRELLQSSTIDYVGYVYPNFTYNTDKCFRDVGFITDGVVTDLVYGGNERSSASGYFYYKFPSQATKDQLNETTDAIRFARDLSKVIAIEAASIEKSFTNVIDIIKGGRVAIPTLVETTDSGIKGSTQTQITTTNSVTGSDIEIVSASFGNVITIISNGTGSIPTIIENTLDGIGRIVKTQITSSTEVDVAETNKVNTEFDIVLDIVENGTGSLPTLVENTNGLIKVTNYNQTTGSVAPSNVIEHVTSSFDIVLNIVENGTGSLPIITSYTTSSTDSNVINAYNTLKANIEFIQKETIAFVSASWSEFEYNEASCSRDIGYIVSGAAEDLIFNSNSASVVNGKFYYEIPSEATTTQLGPTLTGVRYAKGLIKEILSNNIFVTASTSKKAAYDLLVANKDWIQTQTIANINAQLDTVSYNEAKCRRDVGYIVDAVATDILYGGNERSIEAGTYYYLYPSEATGSQLTQTLEGITYAKNISYKVVSNELVYNQITSSVTSSISDINKVASGFDIVLNIIENGTGSIPSIVTNADFGIKKSSFTSYTTSSIIPTSIISSSNDSFNVVLDVLQNGTGSLPYIIDNTRDLVKITTSSQYVAPLVSSNETANMLESKFNIVLDIVANGTASYTASNYTFTSSDADILNAYNALKNNIAFIQNETIAYISSSWSGFQYDEAKCKRDVGYIVSGAAEDLLHNSTSASIVNGKFYYEFPSEATGSQLQQTLDGIAYAKDLSNRLIRGSVFQTVSNNKLNAKNLIVNNKEFIANEVVAYVSASWDGFGYNEVTCKRDVGYILDAVITDIVYGGNQRSVKAGEFYYLYPSQAIGSQLAPTLSGIEHAKNVTNRILKNLTFQLPSTSAQAAYDLLIDNKDIIQTETIAYLNSAWSFFEYNEAKCRRDVGYIVDAVATDILYGGNESAARAGEYYYSYPSLAIVDGDGDAAGQLGQTLDGVKYAKGIAQKIITNTLLQAPTTSQKAGWNLLVKNKPFIQAETIAFLSSSWSGVDGFYYNEASCSRDVAYIVDSVATDLIYGGNQRSSKAGEYYFLYPSAATVSGSVSPTVTAQLGPTVDGISFAAGVANKVIQNIELTTPSQNVIDIVSLLKSNKTLIQNETIEFIDAYYPYLVYNRNKCRRDVGYIMDAVITDLYYGGNQRSVVAGDYYFRYPNLATTNVQLTETVLAIAYAKELAKTIAQNIQLEKPQIGLNIDNAIKVTTTNQYTSSVSAGATEINSISQSISIVNTIIRGGETQIPTTIRNVDGLIKFNNTNQITSSISGNTNNITSSTSAYGLIRDIVYNGTSNISDALVSNYSTLYGLYNQTPQVYNISSLTQSLGNVSGSATSSIQSEINDVTSSYDTIINIVSGGLAELPTIVKNSDDVINVTNTSVYTSVVNGNTNSINKINTLYDIVLNIVESGSSAIPTLYSNSTSSIKVTSTPQIFSSSYAERVHGKIISASFGLVGNILENGTGSVEFRTGSILPSSNIKVVDAYTLLVDNAPFIVNETIAFMSSSWSNFNYNQAKCERDLGYIISGSAFDLLYGGNSASFANGVEYLKQPSMANDTQLDQTLTAIGYAAGLAEKVVQGVFYQHISASALQGVSASYVLMRNNKPFIVSESIAYLSSSWSEFQYNQISCSRDITYIVDAVSTDLLYGGNERSIVAGDYYYRYPSEATTIQLQPTLDGIEYSKGLAAKLASGSTSQTAPTERQYVYDLITDNKEFIRTEALAYVNAKYEDLIYDNNKCFRDLGYILDAIRTDVLYGGNQRASKAGEFYYLYPSKATDSQLIETLDAINYTSLITDKVIKSDLLQIPQIVSNTSASIKVTSTPQISGTAATQNEAAIISSSIGIVTDIILNGVGGYSPTLYSGASSDTNIVNAYNNLKNNIPFIQSETIAYLSSSWSGFSYNEISCSRDIAYIVSGAAEDLLYGVDSASIVNGKYYYEFPSAATSSQLHQTLDGIRYASGLAQKVVLNTLFVTASTQASASYGLLRNNKTFIADEVVSYISSSWSSTEYSESVCRRDIGYIVDAVSTDLLYGGNERSAIAGRYYYDYPSQATTSEKEATATAIEYASNISEKLIQNITFYTASSVNKEARQLLRINTPFIQNETIAYISSSWSTFSYNEASCSRDVSFIIDAVGTDLVYGGNERSVEAGRYYYKFPSTATTAQLEPTTDGITYAGRVAQKIIQNILFQTASIYASASVDLLRKNRAFIQAEAIEYVSSSWSQVVYNQASCSRDVGYIIDAVATDLLYGGEERTVTAADFYYRYPSRATVAGVPSEANQLDPTITGIRYAGGISSKIVLNSTFTAPSQSVLTARELLVGNKLFIQKETIAFLSSSWSTLQYNEASCSRDVGFIIDGVATDLVYGGNQSSIQAGSYYYYIPSVAIQPSYTDNGKVGQKLQTVDGINYARGVAEKVVAKIQLVYPGIKRQEAADRLIAAKEELKQRALSYTNGAFPYLVYNEASCSRDTGLIVDALRTDLLYGGNERGIAAASSYYTGQYGNAIAVTRDQRLETLETNRYLRTRAEFIAANAPQVDFGSLIVATGIDYSYNGAGVTFKALPPNQGGSGIPDPAYEITELGGGRIYFTSGNQDGDFRIGKGLSINQATGTLVGRTFSKSLFTLVTPFSLALEG